MSYQKVNWKDELVGFEPSSFNRYLKGPRLYRKIWQSTNSVQDGVKVDGYVGESMLVRMAVKDEVCVA